MAASLARLARVGYQPELWHDFGVTIGGLAGALTKVALSGASLQPKGQIFVTF